MWPLKAGTTVCITRPSEIFVNVVFKHFTLLAFTQSVDNLFHSLLSSVRMSTFWYLHLSFTNITSCPLVLPSFLSEKKIFLSIFSYPFNIQNISI